jgi:hypothetical protein
MAVKIGIDLGTANRMRKNFASFYFKDLEKVAKLDKFLRLLNLLPLSEKNFKNKILIDGKNPLCPYALEYGQCIKKSLF